MGKIFEVEGGTALRGTVQLPAAKNSILPLLAASLLCDAPVCFSKVPMLSDVEIALAILNHVGAKTTREGERITVCPARFACAELPTSLTQQMRASVLFLAPMLSRFGRVKTGASGGCQIGARPIDIHLDGLVKMGGCVCYGKDGFSIQSKSRLHAVDYTLRYPSVGATETLMMAAVKAKGITVLRGVACEPEIVDLAAFLNACGAKIEGAGTSVICIVGVSYLGGVSFTPLPDRIVGATFACAVAAAGGEIQIENCIPLTFAPVLDALCRAGCMVEVQGNDVLVARTGALSGIGHLTTGVYPAFPTDAAPLLAAALLQTSSQSNIEDVVFEDRFSCASGFAAMGANVAVKERSLAIGSLQQLHGAKVFAPDLRGGAALVIAALGAHGKSEIGAVSYILRGYANFAHSLSGLGAKITEKNN